MPQHSVDADQPAITFSFGKNWTEYLDGVTDENIGSAVGDIEQWLGADSIAGKRVLDIGSGSGIHSRAFQLLGAESVLSLDVDPHSVAATTMLWERSGKPENWQIAEASVLDEDFLAKLGSFDIVYSWGVLHHTGSMWPAIDNALSLVRPDGAAWIALYTKGPSYDRDLAIKKRYNAASALGKRTMVAKWIAKRMLRRLSRLQNPLAWNQPQRRGMDTHHDIIDWLGGLPYEVASADETVRFAGDRGFVLGRIDPIGEGGCSTYVFRRSAIADAKTAVA